MSNLKFSYSLSKALFNELRTLTEEDIAWQNMEPIKVTNEAYKLMCTLYIKYVMIANSFTKLMNITISYHKRERLKPILSNLHSRVVELKAEMFKLMKADFPYLDNLLIEMKISRRDLEIKIPEYFRMERAFVVKEFFRFTEKIKTGLVLKQFPRKPVAEMTLNLKDYFLAEIKAKEITEGEREGRRIERLQIEDGQKPLSTQQVSSKRPSKFKIKSEFSKIIEMMGEKRHNVFQAMKTIVKQPIDQPYESWKYHLARDVVRAPYFQGKKYFYGYDKLVDVYKYRKFLDAISLIQRHERARMGAIYYAVLKDRHEKQFTILANKAKGLKTDLKSKDDFKYFLKPTSRSILHADDPAIDDVLAKGRLSVTIRMFGLLPELRKSNFCQKYQKYLSQVRQTVQQSFEELIAAEARGEEELARYGDIKDIDIVDEILEYFRAWHHASKPLASKFGWDLLDIPSPLKKVLPPPTFVVGIPKSLADNYVEQNFDKIIDPLPQPSPLTGTALIVSGNHITKEKYMEVKVLASGKKGQSDAKPSDAAKLKDQKQKEDKKGKKKEEEGYTPSKSQIPLFVIQRSEYLDKKLDFEETEIHPLVSPKLIDEDEVTWKIANRLHLENRESIDKKMIDFQKLVRKKMTKKHRKAENLKKRNLPVMKKPKKEWSLKDEEKWNTVYALAKDGYFRNYRHNTLANMPGVNSFSFANYELIEEYLTEPEPSWGEIFNLVKIWCVLPLADVNVRQYGPLVSAVGFVGPREIINRLVCSVAHESGAVLICIDPLKPEGEIPLKQLASTIMKLAKSAQPTIILVDNCHFLYGKKSQGGPQMKSSYAPVILKIKKQINRKFGVLLIGATDKPEMVTGGKMRKVFDRVIPFPIKDYHTSSDYWGKYVFRYPNVPKNFPYTAMVEPTQTYKTPQITKLISETVFTRDRQEALAKDQLNISEFAQAFKTAAAAEKDAPGSFKTKLSPYQWASKTFKSLKARKKMLKELLDERNETLNADAKSKKKK